MLKLVTGRRRLLRKRMYKAPHQRQRGSYFRENKNLNKHYQEEYKNTERIIKKRRPRREAISGFKMSYRYKYYNNDIIEEDEEEL
ncbi:MAG: hypothetical protein K6A34_02150 [Methanobrevibacter sp.]|nr:hypothetical protein [Methanobrevibacter sp.]